MKSILCPFCFDFPQFINILRFLLTARNYELIVEIDRQRENVLQKAQNIEPFAI